MSRDDFSKAVIDRLARRVGMRCSNPTCRAPTSGPDSSDGVTNVGVAAHIHAASEGGARYDSSMSAEARSDIGNGIWLCQTHAKLIDDDEVGFPPSVLRAWKEIAEHMAALEALGYEVRRAAPFAKLEAQAPALLAEMREDFSGNPLTRQLIVLSNRGIAYNHGSTPCFTYFLEEHHDLMSVLTIMQHVGAIYDVAFNSVPRFNFTEEFVAYLVGG